MKINETLIARDIINENTKYHKAQVTDKELAALATAKIGKKVTHLSIARLRKAMKIACKINVENRPKTYAKRGGSDRIEALEQKVDRMLEIMEAFSRTITPQNGNGIHNQVPCEARL
jgi:hypothetical protein